MPNLLEQHGAQPQKQPKWVPIFMDRSFTGLFTQRSVLHDPSSVIEAKYYGGRPDALWMGNNVELTNRLTLQRRPGLTEFSSTTYPTPPIGAFSFQLSDGTIRVIIDTAPTPALVLTSVADASGGNTVYTGTITGGGSNAYVGMVFSVTGFTGSGTNNGTFTCVASTLTTLTLNNPNGIAETDPATALSAGAVYWDEQNGTKQLLFGKQPSAGQTHFVAVAGVLYAGDGVDTWKYTPLNPNFPPGSTVSVWKWGIAAPTTQPAVQITESGAGAPVWQANTIYSTMGLTVDPNGFVWQLIFVNADGTNVPNAIYGTAGSGSPPWNQALYGTTTETSGTPIVWKNLGVINQWQPNTLYGDMGTAGTPGNCCIYDPTTQAIYGNFHNAGALGGSGGIKPNFVAIPGTGISDFHCKWFLIGKYTDLQPWQSSHAYEFWYGGGSVGPQGSDVVIEPFLLPPPNNQPIYVQVPTNTGTSGNAYVPFPTTPTPVIGQQQPDGQLLWMCLGSATWTANTVYFPWQVQGTPFGCVQVGGNMHVATAATPGATSLESGATLPTFGTTYGATSTLDGTADTGIIWICVGPQVTWVGGSATTGIWNLPLSGFQPPQPSQLYGGSTIDSSTALVETVIISGKSGTTQPGWGPIGTDTVDNGITWFAESVVSAQSVSWSNGLAIAYSYKARAFDDFYSPGPIGGGNNPPQYAQIPAGSTNTALGLPTGSATEAVSTASPAFLITGGNAGAVLTISGIGSTDPQVDTIIIWMSPDEADGQADMFELTEIPAPKPIGGIAQPWSFQDFLPLTATNLYPGLNLLIPAPIDDVNDPPDATFLPMVYNFQRIWGADGEFVPFSGGPDTQVGNPNEAFAPVDALPFLAPVTRVVKSALGLITFLTDSIEVIAGGPSTNSFFSVTWSPGIGLLSYNALDTLAGEIYFFSSDNQFRVMTPNLNISNAGFAIGDQLANQPTSGISDTTWDASKVYVASHQNGTDNCIFVSDGSTGWYRLNPRQAGAGITSNTDPVWSPFAVITNGCQMVQSIETVPGIKKLLVGSTEQTEPILERNLSVFTDNGTMYDAWFVMGSITLAHPGQLALLKFFEFDFSGVSYQPTISYLLNEISGTFKNFTTNPVFDPPSLYGTTITPSSYSPNRYYLMANASLARCRHLQLMVDFGQTANGDELYTATIFGRLMIEV